jgi:ABC-type glycerol-3-phosphate transport system permease component
MAALPVTLSSAFVAFGFAYFRFPGRSLVFGLVLATMMPPAAVTMIPNYLVWNGLGLTDTTSRCGPTTCSARPTSSCCASSSSPAP